MLIQLLINGLISGAIISLVALGYALVYNTTRIFHIAYSTLYMIAPYILLTFFKTLGINFYLSTFISILGIILLSTIIELLVYKPLENKKSSLNVVMISSIGVMTVIINLIAMFYGNETKVLNPELSGSLTFGELIITKVQLAQFLISIFLISLFFVFLKFTEFGLKTRAMRDDTVLCTIFAVNITTLRIKIFALSGFFAAVGGILVSYDVGMDPYIGMPMLLNAVVAIIIGGIGKFHAPILGGFIIGILQSLSVYFFSANWQDAVTFTVLIIFLFLRPQGIFGEKQRIV